MKKIIKPIFPFIISILFLTPFILANEKALENLNWFKKIVKMFELVYNNWTWFVGAVIVFIGLYFTVKFLVEMFLEKREKEYKNIEKKNEEKYKNLDKRLKDISEAIKITTTYSSITDRIVCDYILTNVTSEDLSDYLYNAKLFAERLRNYGIPEDILIEISSKHNEKRAEQIKKTKEKLKEQKNEHNSDNGKISK